MLSLYCNIIRYGDAKKEIKLVVIVAAAVAVAEFIILLKVTGSVRGKSKGISNTYC